MSYLMSLRQVYAQVKKDLENNVERNLYEHVPLHSLRGTVELINNDSCRKLNFTFLDKEKKEYSGSIDLLSFGKFKIKKMVDAIKDQVKEGL